MYKIRYMGQVWPCYILFLYEYIHKNVGTPSCDYCRKLRPFIFRTGGESRGARDEVKYGERLRSLRRKWKARSNSRQITKESPVRWRENVDEVSSVLFHPSTDNCVASLFFANFWRTSPEPSPIPRAFLIARETSDVLTARALPRFHREILPLIRQMNLNLERKRSGPSFINVITNSK